jgi:hypothetical protein
VTRAIALDGHLPPDRHAAHEVAQETSPVSNVSAFLPKLTLNGRFIGDFLAETAPCFALGMVEEHKQQFAALALRPGVTIPPGIMDRGFEFGHSLLGNAEYEVVHFAFEFSGFATYNVLLNPNKPSVRAVVACMIERGGYFILAFDDDQRVTTFQADVGQQSLRGLSDNYQRIQFSTTTERQYRQALAQFNRRPDPPGQTLAWVCHEDPTYLDLTKDRMEMSPALMPEGTPAPDTSEPPAPNWQPLSMLPVTTMTIDAEVEGTAELRASLLAARDQPHLLDDETVHRTLRLCTDQLAFVPIYREQLARWRSASPSRSQRSELSRLVGQLERLEGDLREVLTLAEELKSGTIDAILRMDEGELGMAVFEGRLALPNSEPPTDELRIREQRAIAVLLDAHGTKIGAGVDALEILAQVAPQMPLFKRLLDICREDELNKLCGEFPGLYRFADAVNRVAANIQPRSVGLPR